MSSAASIWSANMFGMRRSSCERRRDEARIEQGLAAAADRVDRAAHAVMVGDDQSVGRDERRGAAGNAQRRHPRAGEPRRVGGEAVGTGEVLGGRILERPHPAEVGLAGADGVGALLLGRHRGRRESASRNAERSERILRMVDLLGRPLLSAGRAGVVPGNLLRRVQRAEDLGARRSGVPGGPARYFPGRDQ